MVFISLIEFSFQITQYYPLNIPVILSFQYLRLLAVDTLRSFVYLNLPLPLLFKFFLVADSIMRTG